MNVLLSLAVALSLCWFGQQPPHGEFERDWLTFLLLSLVVLVAGARVAGRRGNAPNAVLRPGPALVFFLALWAGLVLIVVAQSVAMPETAWGGRNALTLCWLVGAMACLVLGGLSADQGVFTAVRTPPEGSPAWVAIAAGVALAALFNAVVAWVQVLPLPQIQAVLPAALEPGRGYGALLQPNLTATLLVLGVASVSAISGMHVQSAWRLYLARFAAACLGSGVAVTGSRVGMGLLVLLALWGLTQWLWARRGAQQDSGAQGAMTLGLLAVGGFALAILVAGLHGAEFATPLDRSAALSNGRMLIFANAWQMGSNFPLFGAGFGQFAYWHVELPYQPKMPGYLTHAHNLPLQFWAELGGLGVLWLVLAMVALTWPLGPMLRGQRISPGPGQQWALIVIVLLLGHSMTEMPLWSAPFLLLFAFAAGVWLMDTGAQRGPAVALAPMAKQAAALGAVSLAVSIWVYVDYLKVAALYEGARGAPVSRDEAVRRAFTSVVFRPTAEFAAATSAQVTRQTAPAYRKTLPYLWRYVTDPRMFEWQLRVAAWDRDEAVFEHYANRFAHLYPQQYAAFKAAVAAEKAESPWVEFKSAWP